jgi:hypothetical protein
MAINPAPAGRGGRLAIGRAIGLFFLYVFVFAVGGGLGAGIPALLFELISEEDITRGENFVLYAIMFGVTGYIAYRLAQRVAEGGDREYRP